jgi:hypothetical protein
MTQKRSVAEQSQTNELKILVGVGNIAIDVALGNMTGIVGQAVPLLGAVIDEANLLINRAEAIKTIEENVTHLTEDELDNQLNQLRE